MDGTVGQKAYWAPENLDSDKASTSEQNIRSKPFPYSLAISISRSFGTCPDKDMQSALRLLRPCVAVITLYYHEVRSRSCHDDDDDEDEDNDDF